MTRRLNFVRQSSRLRAPDYKPCFVMYLNADPMKTELLLESGLQGKKTNCCCQMWLPLHLSTY